jgi:hypothetical protein
MEENLEKAGFIHVKQIEILFNISGNYTGINVSKRLTK